MQGSNITLENRDASSRCLPPEYSTGPFDKFHLFLSVSFCFAARKRASWNRVVPSPLAPLGRSICKLDITTSLGSMVFLPSSLLPSFPRRVGDGFLSSCCLRRRGLHKFVQIRAAKHVFFSVSACWTAFLSGFFRWGVWGIKGCFPQYRLAYWRKNFQTRGEQDGCKLVPKCRRQDRRPIRNSPVCEFGGASNSSHLILLRCCRAFEIPFQPIHRLIQILRLPCVVTRLRKVLMKPASPGNKTPHPSSLVSQRRKFRCPLSPQI